MKFKKGFTTVELISVISIIGILTTLTLSTAFKAKDNVEEALSKNLEVYSSLQNVEDLDELEAILNSYYNEEVIENGTGSL